MTEGLVSYIPVQVIRFCAILSNRIWSNLQSNHIHWDLVLFKYRM